MGDMADYYMEQEINEGMLEDEPRVTRASKWKTRAGEKTAIRDLETNHITNIFRMHADGRLSMPDAWLAALEREMERRK